MGYYNDIYVVISAPSTCTKDEAADKYGQLKVLMECQYKDTIGRFLNWVVWYDEELILEIKGNSKWGTHYTDCQMFNAMLNALDELGYAWEFMRVGEETDDIEHTTSCETEPHYLLSTRVVVDVDTPCWRTE